MFEAPAPQKQKERYTYPQPQTEELGLPVDARGTTTNNDDDDDDKHDDGTDDEEDGANNNSDYNNHQEQQQQQKEDVGGESGDAAGAIWAEEIEDTERDKAVPGLALLHENREAVSDIRGFGPREITDNEQQGDNGDASVYLVTELSPCAEAPPATKPKWYSDENASEGGDSGYEDVHPNFPLPQHEPQEVSITSRRHVWIAVLMYMFAIGTSQFLFRLQVFLYGEDRLSDGTFICWAMMGNIVSQGFYSLLQLVTLVRLKQRPSIPAPLLGALGGGFNVGGIASYVVLTSSGGEVSILSPLTSLAVLIPFAFGVLFLRDRPNVRRGFGVALAVAATAFFAIESGGSLEFGGRTFGFFLSTIFLWGMSTVCFQYVAPYATHNFAAAVVGNLIGFVAVSALVVWGMNSGADFNAGAPHGIVFAGGVCSGWGTVALLILARAMTKEAAVVGPISSLYVVVPTLLGIFALGEAAGPWKIAGIIAALLGVVLMGIKDCEPFVARLRKMPLKAASRSGTPSIRPRTQIKRLVRIPSSQVSCSLYQGSFAADETEAAGKVEKRDEGAGGLADEIQQQQQQDAQQDSEAAVVVIDDEAFQNGDEKEEGRDAGLTGHAKEEV